MRLTSGVDALADELRCHQVEMAAAGIFEQGDFFVRSTPGAFAVAQLVEIACDVLASQHAVAYRYCDFAHVVDRGVGPGSPR